MTKAERYRENHRKLMNRQRQEESWPVTILNLGAFVASALIWLALFLVIVPRL